MNYEPELGQAIFGQPFKQVAVPDYVESHLRTIESELERVMWNRHQEDYSSPFGNTGNSYKNATFEVVAYSWDETTEQPFNFKWKDFEISWYKYCGRGMSMNKSMSPAKAAEMLTECLDSIRAEDVDLAALHDIK